MNSRIRNRGLSSKEMLLRRDISQNKPLPIEDEKLSNLQFNLRSDVNQKHNIKLQDSESSISVFNMGDRVFILNDLSKLHVREEYIITNLYEKNGMDRASLQKIESQFRSKKYEVKLSEIVHVSNNFTANSTAPYVDQHTDLSPQFQGFPTQQPETGTTKLQQMIKELSESIPKNRGRPNLKYPTMLKIIQFLKISVKNNFFMDFQPSLILECNLWNSLIIHFLLLKSHHLMAGFRMTSIMMMMMLMMKCSGSPSILNQISPGQTCSDLQ